MPENVLIMSQNCRIWGYLFLHPNMTRADLWKYRVLATVDVFGLLVLVLAGSREESLLEKTQVLFPTYCLFGGLVIYSVGLLDRKLLFEVVDFFQRSFDENKHNPNTNAMILSCHEESNKMLKMFGSVICVTIAGFLLAPLMLYGVQEAMHNDAYLETPIGGVYPWDMKSPFYFTLTYLLQIFCLVVTCPMIICNVGTPVALFMGLVSQFKLTQERFKEIESSDDKMDALVRGITSHQQTLALLEKIQAFGGRQFFLMVFTSASALSLGLFRLSQAQDPGTQILFGTMSSSVIIQLFFVCHYGQKIINEVEKLYQVIYAVPWYLQKPVWQKVFILGLMRARKFDRITALMFSDMSFETFTAVITTSFSYLTFLQTMSE